MKPLVTPSTRADRLAGFFEPATVVLFAGLGGSCIGIEDAYMRGGYRDKYVDLCVNHWEVAVKVHELNHPMTQHLHSDVWEVDPDQVLPGRRIVYLHASPDCTDFSKAKGGMPKRKHIRALADVVIVWGKKRRPDVITLENVEEFLEWGPLMHKRHSKRLWAWIKRRAGKDKPAVTVYGPNMAHVDAADWIERHESAGWSIEPWLMPDPAKRGQEFKRWKGELEALGYVVEAKEIRACDHGTPTTRKRLFVVARCDGKPIIFREPTHGKVEGSFAGKSGWRKAGASLPHRDGAIQRDRDSRSSKHENKKRGVGIPGIGKDYGDRASALKPYLTAASCIDWSQPMLSIFATRPEARAWAKSVNVGRNKHERVGVPQRPLKLKTNQRLAGGLLKHTLESADPFIINIENYGWASATRPADDPLSTVTAGPKGGKHAVVRAETAAFTGIFNHGGGGSRTSDPREPVSTVTGARDARGAVGVEIAPFVARTDMHQSNSGCTYAAGEPLTTVTSAAGHAVAGVELASAYTVSCAHSKTTGRGTYHDPVTNPVKTISASNDKSLVAVSLTQENHTDTGSRPDSPLRTVVGGTVHQGLLAANIVRVAHGDQSAGGKRWGNSSHDATEPLPTVSASKDFGLATAEIAPMTLGAGGPAYSGKPRRADLPANSVTASSRQAVAAAHVVKFRGESSGTSADRPLDTVTSGQGAARDAGAAHAMGVCTAYISRMFGTNQGTNGDSASPLGAVEASGNHSASVVVFLSAFYGQGSGLTGHSPAEPLPSVVGKDRFALASLETTPHWIFTEKALARAKQVAKWAMKHLKKKVEKHLLWVTDEAGKKFALLKLALKGALHIVTDIAMRMLQPRELARAQGFADSYIIDRTVDGKWVKKADQVKLIGNSVCRQVMEAIAYDNVVAQGVLGPVPRRKAVMA